jgi:hypothetical protein
MMSRNQVHVDVDASKKVVTLVLKSGHCHQIGLDLSL